LSPSAQPAAVAQCLERISSRADGPPGTRVVISRGSDVVASARTIRGAYRIEAPEGAYDLNFEHDGYRSPCSSTSSSGRTT
jgi:hypothetical protein